MLKSNINATAESYGIASTTTNDGASRRTASLLEELLVHSLKLCDLYKSARWQTADIQFRGLRIAASGRGPRIAATFSTR